MAMDAEELNHSFESNQRSRTGFASALQMGVKGPHMSMNDGATYSTALSGFHGSVKGDLYRSHLHKHLLPLAFAREDLFNGQQKDDAMASSETHRESKRRKEGPNQGPCPSLPAHGNQESSDHPSSAASMSFQQALLQHALQGLNQSQPPGSNQSQQSVPRVSSDVSRRSGSEALGTSPSMLLSETGPTEIFNNIHGSHMNTPHFKLKNAEAFSKPRTPAETYPTRSSSEAEAINNSNSSTPHLRHTSKSSNDFPRYLVHSSSPVHSNSPKVSIETAHQPCGNASPQNTRTAHAQEGIHAFDVTSRQLAVKAWGNMPLSSVDPYLFSIMEREKIRQWKGIELIASENFTSLAVMEVLGSHLVNKYSEGLPGSRYYGGNECIDQIESLCRERALIAFHLDPEAWGVNVQLYSCTSANFAVYTGLLQPKDRIMGLDSPSGGHLSHGYYTSSGKKVSAASIFFENLPYKVNPESGYIDYDKLEEKALDYRPKILICGGSAYPREWDYARFRSIADKVGAILMCDMAHISGLVAAQECCSPFDYCDIVTTTTHKSLRGPRGGMIFYRRGLKPKKRGLAISADETENYDYEDRVNFAVFPSLQGGPHNNQVGALAVALKQVATPEFKSYIQQVKKNAQALSSALQRRGCKLVTDGTDNHLLLWDLRAYGVSGYQYERVCELCQITLNKNAVFGDSATFAPGGVRIGTPAMTSRGCVEADFEVISEFLLRALQIAIGLQREHGKQNKEFLRSMQTSRDLEELKRSVEKFACSFEMPAFHTTARGQSNGN